MLQQIPHGAGIAIMIVSGIACLCGVLAFAIALKTKRRETRHNIVIGAFVVGSIVTTVIFLVADPKEWLQAVKTGLILGGGGLSFLVAFIALGMHALRSDARNAKYADPDTEDKRESSS